MRHILRMSEWEANGRWYVNDIEDCGGPASKWWMAARMLKIAPTDYLLLLKDRFNASYFHYNIDANVFSFAFNTQADARKFKNWINAEARKAKFYCGD